ncbi:MAG: hypothetical protein ABFD29_03665 [Anaerolineaceae bacterium]
MSDQNSSSSPEDAWKEVGKQFKTLGESLARAFETTWKKEENRNRMKQIEVELENVIAQVGDVVKQAADSDEAQAAKETIHEVITNTSAVGEQVIDSAKPHLINALDTVNLEIKKLIDQMQTKDKSDQ